MRQADGMHGETAYQSLGVQGREGLNTELRAYLRRPAGTLLIDKSPPEAGSGAVPGKWECDVLLGGDGRSALGTLVERETHLLLLFRLPERHSAETTRVAMVAAVRRLPEELRYNLTLDHGPGGADHIRFTVEPGLQIHFCTPGRPWHRGGRSENTTALVRQYFPAGTNFAGATDAEVARVGADLNRRRRETLDWATPADAYGRLVATLS